MKIGGARRDRTADLLHAMQALSQLSYGPISGRRECYMTSFAPATSDEASSMLQFPH